MTAPAVATTAGKPPVPGVYPSPVSRAVGGVGARAGSSPSNPGAGSGGVSTGGGGSPLAAAAGQGGRVGGAQGSPQVRVVATPAMSNGESGGGLPRAGPRLEASPVPGADLPGVPRASEGSDGSSAMVVDDGLTSHRGQGLLLPPLPRAPPLLGASPAGVPSGLGGGLPGHPPETRVLPGPSRVAPLGGSPCRRGSLRLCR